MSASIQSRLVRMANEAREEGCSQMGDKLEELAMDVFLDAATPTPDTASVEALRARELQRLDAEIADLRASKNDFAQGKAVGLTRLREYLAAPRQEVVQEARVVARVQRGPAPHDPLYAMLLPGITEADVKPGDVLYAAPPPAQPSKTEGAEAVIRQAVFNALDDLEAGKDRGTVQCELITVLTTPAAAQAGDTGRGEAARIADEMEAWAEKKMGGPGSSRIDRAMLREWAGQLRATDDAEADAYVIEKMGQLLAEIAVIVKGPEPANGRWSYHDLPKLVAQLKQRTHRAPCCGVGEGELHRDDCATQVADEMDAWAEKRLSGPHDNRNVRRLLNGWAERLRALAAAPAPAVREVVARKIAKAATEPGSPLHGDRNYTLIMQAAERVLAATQPDAAAVDPHGFDFPEYARWFLVEDIDDANSPETELTFGMALGDRGSLKIMLHRAAAVGKQEAGDAAPEGDAARPSTEQGVTDAARRCLPFVAYAFDQGIDGAEEAGRALENALAAHPKQGGGAEGAHKAGDHTSEAGR